MIKKNINTLLKKEKRSVSTLLSKKEKLNEALTQRMVRNKKLLNSMDDNSFKEEIDSEIDYINNLNTPYNRERTSNYFNSVHNRWEKVKDITDRYQSEVAQSYVDMDKKNTDYSLADKEFGLDVIKRAMNVGEKARKGVNKPFSSNKPTRSQYAYKNKIRNFKQYDSPSNGKNYGGPLIDESDDRLSFYKKKGLN